MKRCPPCKGTGRKWGSSVIECELCHGEGLIADPLPGQVVCHWCNGNGRKNGTQFLLCDKCEGRGYRTQNIASELVKELVVREPSRDDGPCVVYLEAGRPRTAHLAILPILSSLQGDVCVCDPYYGTGTLARLDPMAKMSVRFLTHTPDSKEQRTGQLQKMLSEFVREYPNVEFRQHPTNDLHDRFIVCHAELILLGQGLKDIGNKESFVVRLNRLVAADMIDQVIQSFDNKWATATRLV